MTTKDKYKAILLVLASEDVENTKYMFRRIQPEWVPLYPYFKQVYEQYMMSNPNIKVLFVYGRGTSFKRNEYDLVYDDVFENDYPGMITKTLNAFEDIETTYDYDFIVRTNLSTFWNLPLLEKRLESLNTTNTVSGSLIRSNLNNEVQEYIAGYDLVISRNLIQAIIPRKKDIIEQKIASNMEDLSICTAIKNYTGVSHITEHHKHRAGWMSFDPFSEEKYNLSLSIAKRDNLDHFRVKTRTNRNIDKLIHERLLMDIYGKTLPQSDTFSSSI